MDTSWPEPNSDGHLVIPRLLLDEGGFTHGAGLSVVIPVADDPIGLTITLESLKGYDRTGLQIIVCNDGGHEGIRTVCARFGVESVEIVPNGGSYRARNAGIRLARYGFLAFLDADVVVCAGWVNKAMQALAEADYVAANIIHPSPEPDNGVQLYQRKHSFQVRDMMVIKHFGHTAHLLVRRRVFAEVGLFDERMRSAGDVEFGRRVWATGGYRQVYDLTFFVIHPYRDFRQLVVKALRISMGQRAYAGLYPERKSQLVPKPLKLLQMLLPGRFLRRALLDRSRSEEGMSPRERLHVDLIDYFLRMVKVYGFIRPWRRPDSFEWGHGGRAMR